MKHIVRYLLEGQGTTPDFILDGGYYKSGEELIGVSVDSASRHLPATVHKLTKAELVARVLLVVRTLENEVLTQEEAEEQVDAFLLARDMADYA